jgi:mannose-6-phosphate isomerase-like protein (cupin superfamily)
MSKISEYIESGVLEMYVLGLTNEEESREVEQMAASHPEVRHEIERLSKEYEAYAESMAVSPDPTIKPMVLASIDYMERMKKGEPASFPPVLNENSKAEDYKEWIDRKDMVLPEYAENIFAKIIGYTPTVMSAILWIKDNAPAEVHDEQYEKFLILEGTCDITIGDTIHHLKAGDYLTIPLHVSHNVKVTSEMPCKAILQRVAA